MKFTGNAEDIANSLVDLFRNGSPGKAMAQLFVKVGGRHISQWSFNNQLVCIMLGYKDAMGFKQWLAKNRVVKKGEKAFYILAPLTCKGTRKVNGIESDYTFVRGFRGIPVFGYEQTEGDEIKWEDDELINSLPLLEVAKHWEIDVSTFQGNNSSYLGYFAHTSNEIALGTKNLSTWLHELVHASEFNLGTLTSNEYSKNKAQAEIVAEMGATVLAHALGMSEQADNGGCWDYICSWAKNSNCEPAEAAYRLIDRTCKAVNHILTTYDNELSKQLTQLKHKELLETFME